jgi:hypothetical protein
MSTSCQQLDAELIVIEEEGLRRWRFSRWTAPKSGLTLGPMWKRSGSARMGCVPPNRVLVVLLVPRPMPVSWNAERVVGP